MMTEKQRIILFGDSLILSGVRASLETHSNIEVLNLDQPLNQPLEEIRLLCPAAVIVDLGAVEPSSVLWLLHQPDLQLIGINPETHQALVLSSQLACPLTTNDLVQLLQHKDSNFTIIEESG